MGDWSGLTKPEIEERWPGQQAEWFGGRLPTTPGGEGRVHFDRRVMEAVLRVAAEADPGSVLVVVTHGGVIRALERADGRAAGAHRQPLRPLVRGRSRVGPTAGPRPLRAGEPLTLVGTDHRTASPSA